MVLVTDGFVFRDRECLSATCVLNVLNVLKLMDAG